MRRFLVCAVIAGAVALAGCAEDQNPVVAPGATVTDVDISTAKGGKQGSPPGLDVDSRVLKDLMIGLNERLEAWSAPYRVEVAEWMAAPGSDHQGTLVFFNDRGNKQLDFHFLPGDPRRPSATDITYLVDESDGATLSGLTSTQTTAAIDRAMDTWEHSTTCSDFAITKVPDPGVDVDLIDFFLGAGSFPEVELPIADIVHGGWLPGAFLGPSTLGVTFTFTFVEDLNDDGQAEVAFREIYYNTNFFWGINAPVPFVDVESIALHEAGHGLSQAHFGKLFGTFANGKLHFAPFALMNAGYTQLVQDLQGTDQAGHCSLWADWPAG